MTIYVTYHYVYSLWILVIPYLKEYSKIVQRLGKDVDILQCHI